MCRICCLQIVFFLVCYTVCFAYSRRNYHDFCSICRQLWHRNIFYGVLFCGELLCQGSYCFHLLFFCNRRSIPRKNCKSRVHIYYKSVYVILQMFLVSLWRILFFCLYRAISCFQVVFQVCFYGWIFLMCNLLIVPELLFCCFDMLLLRFYARSIFSA